MTAAVVAVVAVCDTCAVACADRREGADRGAEVHSGAIARKTGAAEAHGSRTQTGAAEQVHGCPARMVPVDDSACIDRYEARIDDGGAAVPATDALPSTAVSHVQARAACARAGYRLCTREEWTRACAGTEGRAFAYGTRYERGRCNTSEHDTDLTGVRVERSGSRPGCATPEGVYDLSGNVWEWTDGTDPSGLLRELRGGGAWNGESEARCEGEERRFQPPDQAFDGYGFRCCADRRAPAGHAGAEGGGEHGASAGGPHSTAPPSAEQPHVGR